MTTLQIPDEQAAALKAKAEAPGYTLEGWFKTLAEAGAAGDSAMRLDWAQCPAVETVPEKLSGAWVFRNTRMPVSAVFVNLEDGITIDELIELYDGLTATRSKPFSTSQPAASKHRVSVNECGSCLIREHR